MNSSKRGSVNGYKLESLGRVRNDNDIIYYILANDIYTFFLYPSFSLMITIPSSLPQSPTYLSLSHYLVPSLNPSILIPPTTFCHPSISHLSLSHYLIPHDHDSNICLQLTDTRSNDKKQTLLNYICNVVEKIFPHLLSFHEELKIDEACEGTYILRGVCLHVSIYVLCT